MKNKFRLIECTDKHYALLAELGGTTFYDTFRPFHDEEDMMLYIRQAYQPEKIRKNLADPAYVYRVIYNTEGDIGYTKLIENATHPELTGHSIELEKIYLRKEAQGSGAATVLMEEAVKYARSKGYKTLFLGVWQENKRAISFYRKAGFEVFTTRQFTLGKQICEDYLMKKDL